MILIEDLTTFILSLLIGVVCLNVLFFTFVLWRRLTRQRFFIAKDAARDTYRPVVQDLYNGKITIEMAVAALSTASSEPESEALATLLQPTHPDQRAKSTLVLYGLGDVERWAKQVFGRRRAEELLDFVRKGNAYQAPESPHPVPRWIRRLRMHSVPRALALDNLAMLSPQWAFVFCAEGLRDPSPDVRSMAIRGLGKTKLPQALPLIFRELEDCVGKKGSDLSLRAIKTSIIEFSLDDLIVFTPYISDPNPRMRFFVVDSAREICGKIGGSVVLNKNDFSPEFYEAMLNVAAVDSSPDVRARCTSVVRHFRDARSIAALGQLLNDPNEFVRLHAVRACADRFYGELIPQVSALLRDPKWRVRESATVTLAAIGGGLQELYTQFIEAKDLYQSEQIAEQLQRGGLISHVIAELYEGGEARDRAFTVCQKLAKLQKTSMLSSVLTTPGIDSDVGLSLIDAMSVAPTRPFKDALMHIVNDKDSAGSPMYDAALAVLQGRGRAAGGAV